MCSSIYSFYPVPLIIQCQSFRLTFVLCSLKILPTRFHMGIIDRPSDSSNIGPRLPHSSYNVKMGRDTRPKGLSSSVTSSSSHTSTSRSLQDFHPINDHPTARLQLLAIQPALIVTSDKNRNRYSSSGSS